jgi:hypothetical protein
MIKIREILNLLTNFSIMLFLAFLALATVLSIFNEILIFTVNKLIK